MTVRLLVAGDHFVRNDLLVGALRAEEIEGLEVSTLTLPWPLQPFGPVAEVHEASGDEATIAQALTDVDVCVTQMAPLTESVLDAADRLRLFSVARGGPVNANLAAATRCGVAVAFAPGRNATATAEHTLALMLATMRRIPQTHSELASGAWRSDYYTYDAVGPELAGATVGLVGFGAIGSRVARAVTGLGADVLVHDPYVDPAQVEGVATLVELDELLHRSRVVSLHARLTAETSGMIGAAEIAAMQAGSIVVNCARGGLLDYDALCDALDAGHLFAAAADVFPREPIPAGSRLLRTPNLVMTPHLAGASKGTALTAARTVAGDVARYLRGEPLRHCANPEVLPSGHPTPSSPGDP